MNATKYCAEPQKGDLKNLAANDNNKSSQGSKQPRFNRKLIWAFGIIIMVILVASAILFLPLVSKKAGHTAIIRIPAQATEQSVKDSIAKYLGEDYASACMKAIVIITGSDGTFRHGAYEVEEGMTPFTAARRLARGGQTGIEVTFNGQRTKEDVAKVLASKLEASEEDFLKAFNDSRLLDKFHTDPDHVLCLFFEDKYEFYWTATPEDVLKKMFDNYNDFWTPERVERAEQLNRLPRGIYIISSIVDEETNQSEEKGAIGRLYANRLDMEMPLQADPTVKYALGDFSIRRITKEMTEVDNPFNTYKNEGLPPGPIRLTSKSTINAVLSSRPHDYLYMCASDKMDGTHNFAVTYEEHLQNSKRYQKALDEKGITVNAENARINKK